MTTSLQPDPGDLAPNAPASRRRPTPVTILAAIQVVTALFLAAIALGVLTDPESTAEAFRSLTAAGGAFSISAVDLAVGLALAFGVLAGLELFAAVALLRLRRVGWTLAVLLAGAFLALQIYVWWSSGDLTLAVLLNVVTVLYLNQGQVRAAFGLTDARGRDLVDERG